MSPRTTIVLALAAGFAGGTISQRLAPLPVRAQDQTPIPQEIRAQKFVLVDKDGVNRGVLGIPARGRATGSPSLELMDKNGVTWSYTMNGRTMKNIGMLTDTPCPTCRRITAATDPTPALSGTNRP